MNEEQETHSDCPIHNISDNQLFCCLFSERQHIIKLEYRLSFPTNRRIQY